MTTSRESRIAALPPHLRARLRERLAAQTESRLDAIPHVDHDGPIPLSSAQERMWFLHELKPGEPGYHSALALRLTGPLNVASLTQAVSELPVRHESLRTTFTEVDGVAQQVVQPPRPFALPVVEVAAAELDQVLADEYARPFDLRRGPLFRALLVRLAESEHVLLLTAHHIVIDGWSMGVLVRELAAHYTDPARAPRSPELRYSDYAVWQRAQDFSGQLD